MKLHPDPGINQGRNEHHAPDPINTARGVFFGVIVGLALWAAGAAVYLAVRP